MISAEGPAPRFSILVPTHNQAGLLVLALRSILAQTFQDFEILLVADGCTDGSQEAVRAIGDARIRLFDLPKAPGFGYANRNVALKQARGELVAFLAHDDLYVPDHLEIMDGVFRNPEVQWAYTRPVIVESDGSFHPSSQNLDVPSHLRNFLDKAITVPASTVVYRRACHDQFGRWDDSILNAGDREFWTRLILGAGIERIRFVRDPTALHFRAPWRQNLRAASPKTRDFMRPYPDAWPLAIPLEGNPVEQEVFLRVMLDDPPGWAARFRRDVQAVLDGRLSAFDRHVLHKRREKWAKKTRRPKGRLAALRHWIRREPGDVEPSG